MSHSTQGPHQVLIINCLIAIYLSINFMIKSYETSNDYRCMCLWNDAVNRNRRNEFTSHLLPLLGRCICNALPETERRQISPHHREIMLLGLNSIAIPSLLPSFLPNFWPKVILKNFKKLKFRHVSELGSKLGSNLVAQWN